MYNRRGATYKSSSQQPAAHRMDNPGLTRTHAWGQVMFLYLSSYCIAKLIISVTLFSQKVIVFVKKIKFSQYRIQKSLMNYYYYYLFVFIYEEFKTPRINIHINIYSLYIFSWSEWPVRTYITSIRIVSTSRHCLLSPRDSPWFIMIVGCIYFIFPTSFRIQAIWMEDTAMHVHIYSFNFLSLTITENIQLMNFIFAMRRV